MRVAAALLSKNNPQPALAQLQPILEDKDTPVSSEARYLTGEARIQQGDWARAIETLLPFRDQDPFRNAVGIADRALVRLGYAYAQSGQWEPSRQTYEVLLNRFPQSPWCGEARFGMGWGLQNQKRYDEAANAYSELTRRSAAQSAAQGAAQYRRLPPGAEASGRCVESIVAGPADLRLPGSQRGGIL